MPPEGTRELQLHRIDPLIYDASLGAFEIDAVATHKERSRSPAGMA